MGTSRGSAGITIVSDTTQGVCDSSNQWCVREDVRIGVVEGDPNAAGGQVERVITMLSDPRPVQRAGSSGS